MSRRIGVLVNPTSGKGRAGKLAPQILRRLETLDDEIIAIRGADADEADRMLTAEMSKGLDILVAIGGDGTVHQALQHVVGTSTALGIVPLGTGNDGARTLGLPLDDPLAAVDVILAGAWEPIDVGLVETVEGNRRHFLCVLATGFDATVNVRANRMSWPSGQARYVIATLAELRTFKPVPYRIESDGHVEHLDAMLVAVGNGQYYGGSMQICPGADVRDGLLSQVRIGAVSKLELLRTFPKIYSGSHVKHPRIGTLDAKIVTLDAPGQVATVDGELVGSLPVRAESVPGALRVLLPEGQSAR